MKICPQCSTEYGDEMFFCLEDGTPLRSPANIDLEKTLALPTNIDQSTVALSADSPTVEKSLETGVWQPLTTPPQPLPELNETANMPAPPPTDSFKSPRSKNKGKGKIKFIALAALSGAVVLILSGYLGWRLAQPQTVEIALSNANKQTDPNLNSNQADKPPADLPSENKENSNLNENAANLNQTPSPVANSNKPTPKPSTERSASPTPTATPKENPSENSSPTPVPKTPTPNPPTPTPTEKVPDIFSAGVINGKAVYLYQPRYPAEAKANGIGGRVGVQVLVDESGKVVRASAVSGPSLLRAVSEEAARSSRFNPMVVGGQRVKMSGVIVFNFVPN